jgi:hypothetical protein
MPEQKKRWSHALMAGGFWLVGWATFVGGACAEVSGDAHQVELRALVQESYAANYERSLAWQRKTFVQAMLKENSGKEEAINALFDEQVKPLFDQKWNSFIEARAARLIRSLSDEEAAALIAYERSATGAALRAVERTTKFGDSVEEETKEQLPLFDMLKIPGLMSDINKLVDEGLAQGAKP